jgi:hypothetical protein
VDVTVVISVDMAYAVSASENALVEARFQVYESHPGKKLTVNPNH